MTKVKVTLTPLWEPLLVTNLTKPGNLVKGRLQATVKAGGGCLGRDRTVGRTLPLVFPLGWAPVVPAGLLTRGSGRSCLPPPPLTPPRLIT